MKDKVVAGADEEAIQALSQRWIAAVSASDVDQIGQFITDDVLVIHGNGTAIAGREAVLSDFASAFSRFRVRQVLQPQETIVAGAWAFDRAKVHTIMAMLADGNTRELDSHTFTILRKCGAGELRVALLNADVNRITD